MSKRKRSAQEVDLTENLPHKRQKLNNEEEKTKDIDDISFFRKKIYYKKLNKTIETKYCVLDNITYRDEYSANHKYQTRGNAAKWVCTKQCCRGGIETSGDKFYRYCKEHNADCKANRKNTNVRKQNSLQRMKDAVAISDAPRQAYENEMLLGSAEDFWGYQEVAKRLYDVRRQKGIPKLPERKEDIGDYITNTKLELNYNGAQLFDIRNQNTSNVNDQQHSDLSESELDAQIATALKHSSNIKTRLHALRRQKLSLNTEFSKLADKMHFGRDKHGRFQVFTDKQALEILSKAAWIIVDETFKTAPKISNSADNQVPYDQVWIISGIFTPDDPLKWTMKALPCVYILKRGKKTSTKTYFEVLKFIIEPAGEVNVDSTKCDWNVMMVFERGERNTFEKVFLNCAVYGCGFHCCKALLKNLGDHGLTKLYRNNARFRCYIRKYMMLMLLPSHMVQEAQDQLKA